MLPLIDIVFLLLVFFIYAMLSMVVHRGLRVELPTVGTAQMDRRQCVSVTVTKDNVIYLDDQQVSLDELVAEVSQRVRSTTDAHLPVFISGDRQADLGVAVRVLDRLRRAGIKEVSFEAREGTG